MPTIKSLCDDAFASTDAFVNSDGPDADVRAAAAAYVDAALALAGAKPKRVADVLARAQAARAVLAVELGADAPAFLLASAALADLEAIANEIAPIPG